MNAIDVFSAVDQPDLWAARAQMALSLAWHIVIACFGVGFPTLVLIAEYRSRHGGGAVYDALAHRWAKILGILFAVGAVSGTILSFEMGILWPRLMATFGSVLGLPFAIEGIAFFIEAIFIGIYLYGWDRLPPTVHLLTGLPVVVGGIASAWFVVTANAWLNQPVGFTLTNGVVSGVDPWAAILNPATPVETTHMILAAFMVSGFGVAAAHAWGLRRNPASQLHRTGFLIAFSLGAILTPAQIVVGDAAAQFLATNQPIKLAAIEGLYQSQRGAPLSIGGIPVDGAMHFALQIPDGLSLLAFRDPNALVVGLDTVPAADRPPVLPVHLAFQVMVAIGFGLLALGAWLAWSWWRRRDMPRSRRFILAAIAAGPGAVVAMEAGWMVTELGRQPWIVYRVMRVEDAVTAARGLPIGFFTLIGVYLALTAGTILVLRRTLAAMPEDGPPS
ncbi:MAG: cytochrome ubiquinol oxidase subunit I [Chloroflexi bacterium]|nr:cytochrome ubiquinol oxidase subunit I [Chloroflexota bacterium]